MPTNGKSPLNIVRRTIRFIAGLMFWLNALLLVNLPRPSVESISSYFGLNPSEAALIVFFCAMAVLNAYGFLRFGLDVLYIYAFPFVCAYRAIALAFKGLTLMPRVISNFCPVPMHGSDWATIAANVLPGFQIERTINVQPEAVSTPPAVSAPGQPEVIPNLLSARQADNPARKFLKLAMYPFRVFSIAWCLLIAVTDHRSLLWFGMAIVGFHTLRFLITIIGVAIGANKLLAGAEKRIFQYAEAQVNAFREASVDQSGDQNFMKTMGVIILFRACALLMIRRKEITLMAIFAAVSIYALVYIRLALLFGFLYLAIAKLQYLEFSLLDSMTTAFLLPLAFGSLPNSHLIQFVAGFHCLVLALLGVGVVQAYFRRKLNGFRDIAEELWTALDKEDVKDRISQWAAQKRSASGQANAASTAG